MSVPLIAPLRRAAPLLVVVLVLAASAPALSRALTPAGGAIEGRIELTNEGTVKSAERYAGAEGEPREAARIPVVIYVEGALAGAPAPTPSGAARLVQRNQAFEPTLLVVPVGGGVDFPNGDPTFHNVFSYSRAKRFDLGRYRQGESKRVSFDRPGYVKVLCEVHKWMRAAIIVVENPYYAIAGDAGHFRIDGIPPGRHRVTIEHFDRRTQVDVDVRDGATTALNLRL